MDLKPFSENQIIKNNWTQALKKIGKRTVIEHLLPTIKERLNHNPGVILGSSNQCDRFFSISERVELINECFCDLERDEVTLTRKDTFRYREYSLRHGVVGNTQNPFYAAFWLIKGYYEQEAFEISFWNVIANVNFFAPKVIKSLRNKINKMEAQQIN